MLYNKRIYTPTFQLKNYVWLALFPRFVTILQMTWIDNWIREEMKEKQKTSLQSDMNIISQSILISNIWNLRVYNWRPQCFVNSSKDIRLLYSLYRETCDNTQEKIERFQVGLLLENIWIKLSNIGIILEYFILSLGERRFLEDHWYISCLTIQVGILMVVYWKIMFYR